jgi:hypothetical protein
LLSQRTPPPRACSREDLSDAASLALAEKPVAGVKLREVVGALGAIERFLRVRL